MLGGMLGGMFHYHKILFNTHVLNVGTYVKLILGPEFIF